MELPAALNKRSSRTVFIRLKTNGSCGALAYAVEAFHTPAVVYAPFGHLYAAASAYLFALKAGNTAVRVEFNVHQSKPVENTHRLPYRTNHIAIIPAAKEAPYSYRSECDEARYTNPEKHVHPEQTPRVVHDCLIPYGICITQNIPRLYGKRHRHYPYNKTDKIDSHKLVSPSAGVFPPELQPEAFWEKLTELAPEPHEDIGECPNRADGGAVNPPCEESGAQPKQ